jgi:hypothetical protein
LELTSSHSRLRLFQRENVYIEDEDEDDIYEIQNRSNGEAKDMEANRSDGEIEFRLDRVCGRGIMKSWWRLTTQKRGGVEVQPFR